MILKSSELFPQLSQQLSQELYKYIPFYPNTQQISFQRQLSHKKQFYDLRRTDRDKQIDSIYLNHQMIIARYLSNWTLYQSLIVLHDTGTGKSGVISATFDTLKKNNENLKMLYITNNKTLYENFKNELFKLSQFIQSKNVEHLSENTDRWYFKRNKLLTKLGCEFTTFGTFANHLKKKRTNISEMIKKWENHLIVLDEIHNLITFNIDLNEVTMTGNSRSEMENFGKESYYLFHKFIHQLKNKKLLLLTATPIKNNLNEIAYLLNLVLPLQKQFKCDSFESDYFTKESPSIELSRVQWKEDQRIQFLNHIKGYVSVLKKNVDIRVEYQGRKYPPIIEYTTLFSQEMDEFQSLGYINALESSRGRDFYNSIEQASLCVFPSDTDDDKGLFGEVGFKKYVHLSSRKFNDLFITKTGLTPISYDVEEVDHSLLLQNLQIIKKYSIIYYHIIYQLIHHRNQKQYIYSDKILGSGVFILVLLLNQFFGYQSLKLGHRTPRPRVLFLHEYAKITDSEISDYIHLFNQTELNKNGQLCQVIIGTDKTKEGITLKEILKIHICTPHWNFGKIHQAMGRGIRFGSHNTLEFMEDLKVEIYLHCAIIHRNCLRNPIIQSFSLMEKRQSSELTQNALFKSLHFYQYYVSEIRDVNSKLIEYQLLIGSFDCLLNKTKNERSMTQEKSSNCYYRSCNYKCFGESQQDLFDPSKVDEGNYNIFYFDEHIYELIDKIKLLFLYQNVLLFRSIVKQLNRQSKYTIKQIINTLQIIIDTPILISYYNGRLFYLHRYLDLFYLSDQKNFKVQDSNYLFLTTYSTSPYFDLTPSFTELQETMIHMYSQMLIQELQSSTNRQRYYSKIISILSIISISLQCIFFQLCFESLYGEEIIHHFIENQTFNPVSDVDTIHYYQTIKELSQKPQSPLFQFQNVIINPIEKKCYPKTILTQTTQISSKLLSRSTITEPSFAMTQQSTILFPPAYQYSKLLGSGEFKKEKSLFKIKDDIAKDKDADKKKDRRKDTKGIFCNTIPVSVLCSYIYRLTLEEGILNISDQLLENPLLIQWKYSVLERSCSVQELQIELLRELQSSSQELFQALQIDISDIQSQTDLFQLKHLLFLQGIYKASSRKSKSLSKSTEEQSVSSSSTEMSKKSASKSKKPSLSLSRQELCHIIYQLMNQKNLLLTSV